MMRRTPAVSRWSATALPLICLMGCGGHSGGIGSFAGAGPAPSVRTKIYVSELLAAYGQAQACGSFANFGPRTQTHGAILFDPTLALWYRIRTAPSGILEVLYADSTGKASVGSASYLNDDIAQTTTGTFSITKGAHAGLSGTYFQALLTDGINGSISLHVPNGTTADCVFSVSLGTSGIPYGTESFGISEPTGYLQTEKAILAPDGSSTWVTVDNNNGSSQFALTAALAGSGSIQAAYPGLPAKVQWQPGGTGTITYRDGTAQKFTHWQAELTDQ